MSKLKCRECGAELLDGMKECPSCGCPIQITKKNADEKKIFAKMNLTAVVAFFIGIAVIVMGVIVINKEVTIETYSAEKYDIPIAKFGGDFYTEIYESTDTIVDELSAINSGIEVLAKANVAMVNEMLYSIGILIIALGFGIIAISCIHIIKND